MRRVPRLLYLTVPLCLVAGWAAARRLGDLRARNAEAVVATVEARPTQHITLPEAGTYWVFGTGDREAMKRAAVWAVTLWNDSTHEQATVTSASSPRARNRENRAALDLLFAVRVPAAGSYTLRLAVEDSAPGPVHLRITRFSSATAGAAMSAFGLAALFSVLLLLNAVIWFRQGAGAGGP